MKRRSQKRRSPRCSAGLEKTNRLGRHGDPTTGDVIAQLLKDGKIFAVDRPGEEMRYFAAEAFRTVFAAQRDRGGSIWAAPSLLAQHPDLVAMSA
jgi:hypothetical protein